MIYLVDEPLTETSHSMFLCNIIQKHTDVNIELIEISKFSTFNDIFNLINKLIKKVDFDDIVLCPWSIDANNKIDEIFNILADRCWVIVAAGNCNKPIDDITPARAEKVLTIGTLNKSGIKAALSNYSEHKEIIWIPGTNYNVGWKNASGSSISAALYAAFLAESIKNNNPGLLTQLIKKQKEKVLSELQ